MSIKQKNVIFGFVLLWASFFTQITASAQQWKLLRTEVFAGVSTCNYFGDIGGATTTDNWYGIKDIELFSTRPSFYFGGRYFLRERFAFQTTFDFGLAQGSDKNSKNSNRDYDFSTSFFLPKINLEYTLIKINDLFGKKKSTFLDYSKPMNKTFMLYLAAGAGYSFYHVSINESMANDKIRTDTLENPKYYVNVDKTNAFVWSAGLGMRYFFVKPLAINVSLEYNAIMNDNFDGFATTTNVNDLFWKMSFGLSYRLPTNEWGKISFKFK